MERACYVSDLIAFDRQLQAVLPEGRLMEQVAARMADFLADRVKPDHRILYLVGGGNNGGDALVIARLLALRGYADQWVLLARDRFSSPLARTMFDRLPSGVKVLHYGTEGPEVLARLAPRWIVDGLAGTGATGELRGPAAELVRAANGCSGACVVALDQPSGLGTASGLRAHYVLAVQQVRPDMLRGRGREQCGRVHTVALQDGSDPLSGDLFVLRDLPWRLDYDEKGHKYSRGGVMLFCGSDQYPGAGLLAARGALRGGAGMVIAAVPSGTKALWAAALPEAIVQEVDDGFGARAFLDRWAEKCAALVVGSGLGRDERAKALTDAARDFEGVQLWDGDGLAYLPQGPLPKGSTVLTPHGGEVRCALGYQGPTDGGEQALAAADELSRRFGGAVTVIKGYGTVLSDGIRRAVLAVGGRSLGVPGSGDTLAGLVGARLAYSGPMVVEGAGSMDPSRRRFWATAHGLVTHARAGDLLAERLGPDGLLASQIADAFTGAQRGDR